MLLTDTDEPAYESACSKSVISSIVLYAAISSTVIPVKNGINSAAKSSLVFPPGVGEESPHTAGV
jgi:hypothetical protein